MHDQQFDKLEGHMDYIAEQFGELVKAANRLTGLKEKEVREKTVKKIREQMEDITNELIVNTREKDEHGETDDTRYNDVFNKGRLFALDGALDIVEKTEEQ